MSGARRGMCMVTRVLASAIGVVTGAAAQSLPHDAARPATASAPALTVKDVIEMSSIGTVIRDALEDEDYVVVSPDGAHVAVVVNRGNVTRNVMDYALLVFRTAELLRTPMPDTVAQLASSSNRPAITHVQWLADGGKLAFLGEHPDELPQVYTVDIHQRRLIQRTHATTVITAFDASATGETIVYTAETTPDTTQYAAMRAHGFVLAPDAPVSAVIDGKWETGRYPRVPRLLTVVRGDRVTTLPLPSAGYAWCATQEWGGGPMRLLQVAPTGDAALVWCSPQVAPPNWADYRQPLFRVYAHMAATYGYVFPRYLVVDLTTGATRMLDNAPAPWWEGALWAPDGRSIVLANALLPLDVADSAERAARQKQQMVAEVDVHTGAVTVIARQDSLVPLRWDPRTSMVVLSHGWYLRPLGSSLVSYRKTGSEWSGVAIAAKSHLSLSPLVVDQDLNTPPRLMAVDPETRRRHVVFDPNPGLLTMHRFAHEEVVHWRTRAGANWIGGLFRPPDYVQGRRYPLVIQSHGFDSTQFWPDGAFSTAEAAQAMAGRGIMVLQLSDPAAADYSTSREAPLMEAAREGAIDYLDSLGLIDRTRVGLEGFSRTCYHTLYFLTHSRYAIAAAAVTDGVDMSYVQRLVDGLPHFVRGTGAALEVDEKNGGPPAGTSMATWLEHAPGFNIDHITAPLRLTALNPESLLAEWEPYAGLLLQGKPAEMVYIPDGTHRLVKPWERLTSQQGAVDWFTFWLKGEEDSDPAKAGQYARWHALRAMRDSTEARAHAQ